MSGSPLPDAKEIFLSDSTLDTRPDLTAFPPIAANPLLSIGRCYDAKTGQMKQFDPEGQRNPFKIIRQAIRVARCAAGDSGGFQVLMGKLPANLDPRVTVQIYKEAGFRSKDKPIQLDLPPPFGLAPMERLALIQQSALNYHIMAAELPGVVPVVHGWTEAELRQSFEWISDPDRLASGSNVATAYEWPPHWPSLQLAVGSNLATGTRTKSRMTAAAGANLQTGQFVNDCMNPSHSRRIKTIATGSNMAANTPFANDHMNPSRSRPIVTPACLTEAHGTHALDHVVSRPKKPTAAIGSNIGAAQTYALDHVLSTKGNGAPVAIGSNIAAGRNYVFDHIRAAGERKARIRVPMKTILERWAIVARLLNEWDLLADAGSLGQSLHYQHFGFLAGFAWGDSSAWRLKSYMGEIALPYEPGVCIGGWRHVGLRKKRKGRKITPDEYRLLPGWLNDPTNPLSIYAMTPDYFLELVRYNIPQWRDTRPTKQWPLKPFEARCLWNAWIFKEKEETWINSFANDPDRLYYALLRRFAAPGFGRLRNELRFFYQELQRPYVQTKSQVFLKGDVNGST